METRPTIDDLTARSVPPPTVAYREGEYSPDEEIIVTSNIDGKTYRRLGGCHMGCGACCEVMLLPIDPRVLQDLDRFDDWRKWVELHGVQIIVQTRAPFVQAYITATCKHLTDDKKCGVYGTDDRPKMCSHIPYSVYDIVGTGLEEACSYKWEEVIQNER